MKVVLHVAWRANDLRPLAARFADLSFAITRTDEDFAREITDADILVMWSAEYTPTISRLCRETAHRLKWLQFTTSGIDTALKNGGFNPGLVVTNCAGLRAVNLAEHAFTLLLFLARQMRTFEKGRDRGLWLRSSARAVVSLQNTTLLILGMGAIGQAVARRARAFDMNVIAVSRAYRPDGLVQEVFARNEALSAFAKADWIAVCLPSNSETRGFVDCRAFAAMKRSAVLVNVSRGDVIVEDDLAEACANGVIAGAGLDVTTVEPLPETSRLWTLDNVVITPHIGGQGNDETELLIKMVSENLRLYIDGQELLRRVDY